MAVATITPSGPSELVRGYAVTLALTVRDEAGATLTPSGWAVRLLRAGEVLASGSGTGAASWSVTAASTWSLGDDYRLEWSVTAGGATHRWEDQAVVCHSRLYPVVTLGDLVVRQPALVGGASPLSTEARVHEVLAAAWQDTLDGLRNRGRRSHLVLAPSDLRGLHIERTLEILLSGAAGRSASSAATLLAQVELHRQKQAELWRDLTLREAPDDPTGGVGTRGGARGTLWLGGSFSSASALPLGHPGVGVRR